MKVTSYFFSNESLREECGAPLAAGRCVTAATAADKQFS